MISRDDLRRVFRQKLDPDHDPLNFQYETAEYLLDGNSVILQAPTGAGKTNAALLPFIAAREHKLPFPAQMLHAAPMRVLVDSFHKKATALNLGLNVTVQTGEAMDDVKLRGDLIYLTIDQLLSSFLGIAFSLSKRQANLNAGAVAGSYLVLDEFHLFDPDASFATVIEMLRWLNGLTPFLLMTATVSDEMIKRLQSEIGAEEREVKSVKVSEEDLMKIPSQANKVRTFHAPPIPMSAQNILDKHKGRSIVVCNTVKRAQCVYRALLDAGRTPENTCLLHARFYSRDRTAKNQWVISNFGKDAWPSVDGENRDGHDAILVATQVIEVGLDISSEALHTEVAPASAVLQRAGRCARFEGQHGDVYVYPIPPDEHNRISYAPYVDDGHRGSFLQKVCEDTLAAMSERDGQPLTFTDEAALVNRVHRKADEIMLDRICSDKANRRNTMLQTVRDADAKEARELIRDVEAFSVVVHPDPDRDTLRLETLSLHHSTVHKLLREKPAETEWLLRYYRETEPVGESEAYVGVEWSIVKSEAELWLSPILALNPRYAEYSAEYGLELRPNGDASGPTRKSPPRTGKTPSVQTGNVIRLETYAEHISRVLEAFDSGIKDVLSYITPRIEARLGLEDDMLLDLARLTLALHDLGKLSREWQKRTHDWQRAIGEPVDDDVMLGHTHTDLTIQRHSELGRWPLPHHAAEGSYLAYDILVDAIGRKVKNGNTLARLILPAVTAIARHHSPNTKVAKAFSLNPYASATVSATLKALESSFTMNPTPTLSPLEGEFDLTGQRLMRDDVAEVLLYMLLVRVLRLSDQDSQSWKE